MIALTLKRPWHAAILFLGKRIENRKWVPIARMFQDDLQLHAGGGWDKKGAALIDRAIADGLFIADPAAVGMYRDHAEDMGIVGRARAIGAARFDPTAPRGFMPMLSRDGDAIKLCDLDVMARACVAPWWFGPYGTVLEDEVVQYLVPVACKGMLGVWKVPDGVAEAVNASKTWTRLPPARGARG